ncbi:hypothetical protein XTPLMG730_3760 [Xanthomonas translucens pv. phlei]|uniref:Uncharacterized protein n=1 Tax=Xanthomonas graminis pv. phlei TaxID=487906 RepID=A0A0K3A9B8_9XANT|nr:hypothetical protein XTPLMG730_3760 [Xanthomonas translucens pv. phlei]
MRPDVAWPGAAGRDGQDRRSDRRPCPVSCPLIRATLPSAVAGAGPVSVHHGGERSAA